MSRKKPRQRFAVSYCPLVPSELVFAMQQGGWRWVEVSEDLLLLLRAQTLHMATELLFSWPPARQQVCLLPDAQSSQIRSDLCDCPDVSTDLEERRRLAQRWATRWSHLRARYNTQSQPSEEHASEVVEARLLCSEEVHGGQEATGDVEESPSTAMEGNQQKQGGPGTREDAAEGRSAQDGGEEEAEESPSTSVESKEQAGEPEEADRDVPGCDRSEGGEEGRQGNEKQDQAGEHEGALGSGMSSPIDLDRAQTDAGMFQAVRQMLTILADNQDRWRRQNGKGSWDTQKLLQTRFAPQQLLEARYTHPFQPQDLFLIVDESGSVANTGQTELFKALVAGATGLIRVFAGSEAHPNKEYVLTRPVRHSFDTVSWTTVWEQPYVHDFAASVQGFLSYARPRPGARLLFWGDTMDMHLLDPQRLRVLLHPYCPVWLLSHAGKSSYRGYEAPRLVQAGVQVIPGISDGPSLLHALRKLR